MKKEQIIAFLKAPFSKSFIISYLFCLLLLLATPLISSITHLLFKNFETIEKLSEKESSLFILNLIKDNFNISYLLMAIIGLIASFIFLSTYALLLTHETITSKRGIFDAERISLKLSDILLTIPKFLGFGLLVFFATFISLALFLLIAILIGSVINMILPKAFLILFGIACFLAGIYFLYKLICYLFTFNLLFCKELTLSTLFNRQKIKDFFETHKKKIFISWLLFFVVSQISYTLYMSIGVNIFQKVIVTEAILEPMEISNVLPIILGILVWSFFVTYCTLLVAIINGKIIQWIEQKDKSVSQDETSPKKPSKSRSRK